MLTKTISAQEALVRWGELWEVLGAQEMYVYPAANPYVSHTRDTAIFSEYRQVVSIEPAKFYANAVRITPEEADVLQALLLGSSPALGD